MNTQKQILTTAALLTLFAVIGAGIVGLTHDSTYDVIKRNENIHDFRTAAFTVAIAKIAQSYYDLGLADPDSAS